MLRLSQVQHGGKVRRDRGESAGRVTGKPVKYARTWEKGECATRVCVWLNAWVFVAEWACEFPPREEVAQAIAGVELLVARKCEGV